MQVLLVWSETGTGEDEKNVVELSEFTGVAILKALHALELEQCVPAEAVLPDEPDITKLTWQVTPDGMTAAWSYLTYDGYFGDMIYHGIAYQRFHPSVGEAC
jgi:hypothetical protein